MLGWTASSMLVEPLCCSQFCKAFCHCIMLHQSVFIVADSGIQRLTCLPDCPRKTFQSMLIGVNALAKLPPQPDKPPTPLTSAGRFAAASAARRLPQAGPGRKQRNLGVCTCSASGAARHGFVDNPSMVKECKRTSSSNGLSVST